MTKVHYAGRLLPRISQPQDDRRRIKFHLTIPSPLDIHTDFGGQERHLSIILMLAPIQFMAGRKSCTTMLSTTNRDQGTTILRQTGDGQQMHGDRRMRSRLVPHMRAKDATSNCCKNSSERTRGDTVGEKIGRGRDARVALSMIQ